MKLRPSCLCDLQQKPNKSEQVFGRGKYVGRIRRFTLLELAKVDQVFVPLLTMDANNLNVCMA